MSGSLIFSLLRPKLSKSPFWISKISLSTYFFKLLPIGFLYGSDFILTNIAIAYGPIAFVQMVKSAIPLIVLFYKLFERNAQAISISVILSMICLFCGQLLIYFHEVEFSWICFIASLCALFTSGTKIHIIEKLLKHKKTAPSTPKTIESGYNESDIQNEGEQNKLNQPTSDNEETSAFIVGLDSFSPAELVLTDDDDGNDSNNTYFYDAYAADTDNLQKKENVQLQFVETNQRNKVKITPKNNDNNGKKNDFFQHILDKLSMDNMEESEDENTSDSELNLIEKKNIDTSMNFTEDIPLTQHQKEDIALKYVFNASRSVTSKHQNGAFKHKKQKMHSMLALFYFMPVSWLTALIAFVVSYVSNVFEYPHIKRESVFVSSDEMMKLLFGYLLSAIIAIALNWCELFMIGRWNALSFCIFGVFKLICIVGASALFFGHSFTFYSFIGYLLCIVGVLCYNWSQIKNKRKVKKDLRQIVKAGYKSIRRMECFVRNKRRLYTKIWSEWPQDNDNENDENIWDYSDSSSAETLYN